MMAQDMIIGHQTDSTRQHRNDTGHKREGTGQDDWTMDWTDSTGPQRNDIGHDRDGQG